MSILGPTFLLLYINVLPCDVIYNIAIYADDTTLYSECDHAFDLWKQLELALNLNLAYETLDLSKKWLVDFKMLKKFS